MADVAEILGMKGAGKPESAVTVEELAGVKKSGTEKQPAKKKAKGVPRELAALLGEEGLAPLVSTFPTPRYLRASLPFIVSCMWGIPSV